MTNVQAPTRPVPPPIAPAWPGTYPGETPGPERRVHPGELCPSQADRLVKRVVRELEPA